MRHIMTRRYDFRPPLWQPPAALNLHAGVLVVGVVGWLALYGWLAVRLWQRGVNRMGLPELLVTLVCIVLGVGLAVGGWSVWRRLRARRRHSRWPALSLEQVARLTPSQFEEYVAQRIFARQGYAVVNTPDVKDGGIDVIVTDAHGRRALVQCKLYRHPVGEPTVRDLYGVLMHDGAHMAYLVTNSTISTAARRWAAGKPIGLIDGSQLVELAQAEPAVPS
jgi:restriction system protein